MNQELIDLLERARTQALEAERRAIVIARRIKKTHIVEVLP